MINVTKNYILLLSHVVNIVNVWTLAAEYLTSPLTNRLTCVNLKIIFRFNSIEIYAGHRRVFTW